MNIFHMKISKITVQYNGYTLEPEHEAIRATAAWVNDNATEAIYELF